jgi:hypothetical protein
MGGTVLGVLDFGGVKGLDSVTHYRASIIGIATLYRYEDDIPENFSGVQAYLRILSNAKI